MNPSTDRIERTIDLKAPRARVWRALADSTEFGAWFGVALDGTFAAGKSVKGRLTHPGYEHIVFEIQVEKLEPQKLLSFRWHPYAIDTKVDYSAEPPTLVVFELEDAGSGTRLKLTESGFDRIPATRRAEAFRMNSNGWDQQMKNIERHVDA
jgi:uncharacterized protein YndB with AHSA1/START domain